MLALVPLIFITNLRSATAAYRKMLETIRVSDVTMARLASLP